MKKFDQKVLVTRPYFPPIQDFKTGCEGIWKNRWLTNDGPVLRSFHRRLAEYMGVPQENLALFVNGTMALEAGFHIMGLAGGDVITTPFTFVATSHALKRIGATPIFADIDPMTLCLDPQKVERLITRRTKAIVPVHVYGNVCDVGGFDRISKKYGIPIIYDAAHAFGIPSIATAGDMTMFSFHPTKLFHSCEGGCLVFKDPTLQQSLFEFRNFAIRSELECVDVGMNGKMNELQALMGCLCLDEIKSLLLYRKQLYDAYSEVLRETTSIQLLPFSANKAYVPVLFKSEFLREKVYNALQVCNVYARRYFFPLLTDFAPYLYGRHTCPIAEDVASRVLTLPSYFGLPFDYARDIARNIIEIVA